MRKKIVIIAMGILLFSAYSAGNSLAENTSTSFTLTPFVGGYIFGNDQGLENKTSYGLGLGYSFNQNVSAEAVYNYIDTEYDYGAGDVDVHLYHLDALYHFRPSQRFVPYISAGIGAINFDPDIGDSDTDWLINYGGGIKYFLNEKIALRGDIKRILSFDDTHNNLLYTIGLTFYLGGKEEKKVLPEKETVVPEPVRPKITPPKPPVLSKPEPVEPVVITPPKDTDGDGVYDKLDRCPETPTGVTVDNNGCPVDSDSDGIPDYLDKCPRTPQGVPVNSAGCWVCKGVEFDFDKWDIKPRYYPRLNETLNYLKKHPDLKMEIQGHTDNIGTREYNQALSEKRATEVMKYFVERGISRKRFYVKGYGFSMPIATNETKDGRAMNRRVQLKPLY